MWKYSKIQDKIVELIPIDKCLHFIIGFFIYVILGKIVGDYYALISVIVIALIKEIRDQIVYKGFDIGDIMATVIPAAFLFIMNSI